MDAEGKKRLSINFPAGGPFHPYVLSSLADLPEHPAGQPISTTHRGPDPSSSTGVTHFGGTSSESRVWRRTRHTPSALVTTDPARSDNLKDNIKIAFTLTPIFLEGSTGPYKPVARWVTDMSTTGRYNFSVEWDGRTYFREYEIMPPELCIFVTHPCSPIVPPGHYLRKTANWGGPMPNPDATGMKQRTVKMVNQSGSAQTFALTRWSQGREAVIAAYPPIRSGGSITASYDLEIQAYVVGGAISDWSMLQPKDLQRPIFPAAIKCAELPESSTWRLCQDDTGKITLKNDQYPELGAIPTTAINTEVDKSVGERILERLDALEQSITRIQEDVASGQQAMIGMRSDISALQISASIVGAIEGKAAKLTNSFEKSQVSLSGLQKTVTDTQRLLSGMEKSSNELNRKVTTIESKVASFVPHVERLSALEESTGRTRDYVANVEKSVNNTRDDLSLVRQLTVSNNLLLTGQSPTPTAPDRGGVPQDKGSDMSPRLLAVEGKAEKLEKSNQEQLSLVRKVIRTVDRRLPVMESKVDKLEIFQNQSSGDVGAMQTSLAGLERRVTVLEERSVGIESEDEGGTGNWPPSPSAEETPTVFPSH